MKDKALSEGFIKVFRKIQDDDRIYKDSVTVHLVLHCILKASHKRREIPFNQQTITIERGQLITGIRQISRETGIPPKKIRSRLAFLENIGFLAYRRGKLFSIISVCNYNYYQSLGNKTAHPEGTLRAHQGHEYKNGKNEKKFINIECNDFERLNAFLSSLPEYQSFSLEAKELILEFINKVREANKTKSIQGGRGSELVGLFKGILDKTDEESLLVGLRKAFRKMEKDGFDFKKRNPTGYVWSVAKSHKIQKNQAKLLAPSLKEREMLQGVQGGEVYKNLGNLINIQGGEAA